METISDAEALLHNITGSYYVDYSMGFDLKGNNAPGLRKTVCEKDSECPSLVFLYACIGLHHYNFLEGRNFEISRVIEYVTTTAPAAASYFITLYAKEPGFFSSSTTFQILVEENTIGKFILTCCIARIKGDTSDDSETTAVDKKPYFPSEPEWPQEDPFEKDFRVKKESELEEKEKKCIHLYLKLGVAMSDPRWESRKRKDFDHYLKIMDVATDKKATLYIRYKDLYRAEVGENDDVDRVAMVRRSFDEDTGMLYLEGQIRSLKIRQVVDIMDRSPLTVCNEDTPCPTLVLLYACMGLHRYNFIKGRNFGVSRVKEYYDSMYCCLGKTYQVILDVKEPAGDGPLVTFNTKVGQLRVGEFILRCAFAYIEGETSGDRETHAVYTGRNQVYLEDIPECPQENPFEKYCVVKESELQDKHKDWILLYLRLAVATTTSDKDFDDDDFKIVEVATDEGLNAKKTTLYIRCQNDRVAIVTRWYEEESGYFSLAGQILSLEQVLLPKKLLEEPKKPKIAALVSSLKGRIISWKMRINYSRWRWNCSS